MKRIAVALAMAALALVGCGSDPDTESMRNLCEVACSDLDDTQAALIACAISEATNCGTEAKAAGAVLNDFADEWGVASVGGDYVDEMNTRLEAFVDAVKKYQSAGCNNDDSVSASCSPHISDLADSVADVSTYLSDSGKN